jgi:hypothetical protein
MIRCFPSIAEGVVDFMSSHDVGKESLPPPEVLEEIREEEESSSMHATQEVPRVAPFLPSVSQQLRDILSQAEQCDAGGRHGMRAPNLLIRPGVVSDPEMYHIERQFHAAVKAASHRAYSPGRSMDEAKQLFARELIPALRSLAAKAEAIENRHRCHQTRKTGS